ncbi:MAG: hypothetical protein IK031_02030 [Bacteroidales bacterium]|nr:hypothetical protein [Bacteroidales bacterium]
MKKIEDIERMDLDELESAALEENVAAPAGLEDRIMASLAAKAIAGSRPAPAPVRWLPYAALAVAAALAAVIFIPGSKSDRLMDTFDDPYLAYAQVEATFQKISDKMAAGVELASKAGETADKTVGIINKVTEK